MICIRTRPVFFLLPRTSLSCINPIDILLLFKIPTILYCMTSLTKDTHDFKPFRSGTFISKVTMTFAIMTPNVASLFCGLRHFRFIVCYFNRKFRQLFSQILYSIVMFSNYKVLLVWSVDCRLSIRRSTRVLH